LSDEGRVAELFKLLSFFFYIFTDDQIVLVLGWPPTHQH